MNIAASHSVPAEAAVSSTRPLVRIVIVGHVDHGKSTLIGRLLHETGSLPEGKLEALKAVSARRGMWFEWSFLLDALQTERDQGITLDTSQIRFKTASRDIVLIDAPGHAEFLRNMITGASQADAAFLLIDAEEGVRDQTRRHAYLLHLLGIRQVAVVINKMDRVDYSETRFHEIEAEIVGHLSSFGLTATAVIPISARNGDGVAQVTPPIGWHTGPTVLDVLNRFTPSPAATDLPLRFPVQAVYKFDDRRIVAGRIEAGSIAVGDEIRVMPRGTLARVQSIEAWPVPNESQVPRDASAGQSVGLVLDRDIFVARGDLISTPQAPSSAAKRVRARVFWLHETPLAAGSALTVRIGMAESSATVVLVENAVDPGLLSNSGNASIGQNNVGEIELALANTIAADLYADNPRTGRLVIDLNGRIAGGGLVLATDRGEAVAAAPKRSVSVGDLIVRAGDLNTALAELSPLDRIRRFRAAVQGDIVLTTSFGLEDQVLAHWILTDGIDIALTTLDTGRLFSETYDVWAATEHRYGRRIRAIYPNHVDLEALVARQGINAFYDSQESREACCRVRKIEPLNRALAGAEGWVTGLRGDQSNYRQRLDVVTVDAERGVLKLSPLFDWTRDRVLAFATEHNIPINALHAKGFASIGCAPCTRAIEPGEPERAGRWWWEAEGKKECGLHSAQRPQPVAAR